eukprot:c25993_g1_i1 orf=224-841(+)
MGSSNLRSHGIQDAQCWKRTALLVIDMQNDFILPGGPLYVKGGASIVSAVQKAVAFARSKGAMVVWVVREHHASGRDAELFRQHLYEKGETGPTVKGTNGAALVDGLKPQDGDYIIVKYRFSAFFGTNTHLLLQRASITNIVVVGVQTPNCIRQTVFDAVAHDYPSVVVISDATAAANPEVHSANLSDMRNVGIATPTLMDWMIE